MVLGEPPIALNCMEHGDDDKNDGMEALLEKDVIQKHYEWKKVWI